MFGSVLTNLRRTEKETTEVSRFDMMSREESQFSGSTNPGTWRLRNATILS